MSRTSSSTSRKEKRYRPSWWSLFYVLHTRRAEEESAYYRELEEALAKSALPANKQDKPMPSNNVAGPQTGGTGGTITSLEKSTSGPSNNTPDDAPKAISPTLTKESEENNNKKEKSKKDKQDKRPEKQPNYNDEHKADDLPAKERIERKSNASAHKEQSSKRNKDPLPATKPRSVQFAVGTKKGPPSPMAYSSSPNSSKDSYIDSPKTQSSTRAEGPKSILKGNEKSSAPTEPAKKEISRSTITESDLDNFESDDSDEASAVDINEVPASISQRGILKNRNTFAWASSYRATSPRHYKPPMLNARNRTSQPGPLLKDRGREKHSGFHPATIHHFGRGEQIPARTNRMTSMREEGHDTWNGAAKRESTVDYTYSRSKSQAKAQDKRVDASLRQARSNSKLNSQSPSDSRSTSNSSRGPNANRQLEDALDRPLSSGRPIWVFRASDAAADEPDIIVSDQASLDAARKDHHRREKSSMIASSSHRGHRMETKVKQGRNRVSYSKPDSESETSSEGGDSDNSSWYNSLALTAAHGILRNANVSNVEDKPSTSRNDSFELRTFYV